MSKINYSFSATAKDAVTSPLIKKGDPKFYTPAVYYTPEVWQLMWYLIQKVPTEVSWMGTTEQLENGDYLVNKIHVLEQEVTNATTEMTPEALAELILNIVQAGGCPTSVNYWGHSHVSMAVNPSQTDEDMADEFMQEGGRIIRGIYNKKQDQRVDIFCPDLALVHQNVVSQMYIPPLPAEAYDEMDKAIEENVHEYVLPAAKVKGNQQGKKYNTHHTQQQKKKTTAGVGNGGASNKTDLSLVTPSIKYLWDSKINNEQLNAGLNTIPHYEIESDDAGILTSILCPTTNEYLYKDIKGDIVPAADIGLYPYLWTETKWKTWHAGSNGYVYEAIDGVQFYLIEDLFDYHRELLENYEMIAYFSPPSQKKG